MDVVFNEAKFPNPQLFAEPAAASSSTLQPNILAVLPNTHSCSDYGSVSPLTAGSNGEAPSSSTSPITAADVDTGSPSPVVASPAITAPEPDVSTSVQPSTVLVRPENIHSMCTRAKAGIVKPRIQPTLLTHADQINKVSSCMSHLACSNESRI